MHGAGRPLSRSRRQGQVEVEALALLSWFRETSGSRSWKVALLGIGRLQALAAESVLAGRRFFRKVA